MTADVTAPEHSRLERDLVVQVGIGEVFLRAFHRARTAAGGAETVVIANGFKVELDNLTKWHDCAEEVHLVGNCIDPANIMGTTRQANTAVYRIGA